MKTLLLFAFVFFRSPEEFIARTRALMVASAKSETAACELYELLHRQQQLTPVMEGYKGLSEIMLCNYGYNPFIKLSRFLSGKTALEHAIATDPDNTELHFLRYIVQVKCPTMLHYRTDLAADKAILLAYLKQSTQSGADQELRRLIISFFNINSTCLDTIK